ncbi:hypothetical protein Gohar_022029 [Gossypium harknessii]|uniref:Uncharacterized protein n=1 Tax=Gossypium harknessii TaxID=34285 RepID=A0A7J9IAC9_9ROSI|nr:hypothetical protein [Gossypium harknessii]
MLIYFLPIPDLQLDVKGCHDVYASFDKYVEVERLEGDNKYHAEQYGLQDAKKGVLFIDFPPVLQLQLKRFEYDFMRDTMVKVSSYNILILRGLGMVPGKGRAMLPLTGFVSRTWVLMIAMSSLCNLTLTEMVENTYHLMLIGESAIFTRFTGTYNIKH